MFYIFTDTNTYYADWAGEKEKPYGLWEYYIFRKFEEIYGGEKPTEEETEALLYLAELTKQESVEGRWRENAAKVQRLLKCWYKTMAKIATELKQPDEDTDRRRICIILYFMEEAFVQNHDECRYEQNTEEALYRVIGRCRRIRCKYEIADSLQQVRVLDVTKRQEKNAEDMTPSGIKAYLDQYIIGQEDAKRTIATAVFAHSIRIKNPEQKFPGNTVLLIGASGCGKTEIMRRIRDLTGLPMVFTDVSSLAPAQWGSKRQIEDVLRMLYEEAGGNLEQAQRGIIFMDEFDKLLIPMYSSDNMDISQEIQSQMLTILEGTDAQIKYNDSLLTMDTSNILFVLSGAFAGIQEYIHADKLGRMNAAGSAGFGGVLAKKEWDSISKGNINHEVLIRYGMKRELAGRISQIAVLEKLSKEALIRILTEAKDSIVSRYQKETELISGVRFQIKEEVIEQIAEEVQKEETGARALNGKLREWLRELLYELPGRAGVKEIVIEPQGQWRVIDDTIE